MIFPIFPATIRLENVERTGSPIGWEPELGARIGVMPRDGTSADVKWFELDPCYVFHPMNARDDGDRVVLEVCRYARLPLFEGADTQGLEDLSAKLTRWTLDLAGGGVKEERLDDVAVEFPRFDERRAGLSYRHGYGAGIRPGGEEPQRVDTHLPLGSRDREAAGSRGAGARRGGRADLRPAPRGSGGGRRLPAGRSSTAASRSAATCWCSTPRTWIGRRWRR